MTITDRPQQKLAAWLDGQLPSNGVLFRASYFSTGVADDASLDFRIRTGAAETPFWIRGKATGDSEYVLYEGINATSGTPVTAQNLRLASSTAPTVTIFHSPNVTAGDISGAEKTITGEYVGAAVGEFEIGVESGPPGWILQANKTYMFRHTNRGGAPKALSDVLRWEE